MSDSIIDAQVSKLIEENSEMKDRIKELEKIVANNQKNDIHEFKEIVNQMKEQLEIITSLNEQFQTFSARKEWIDVIIEKIKKILPIK